MNDHDSWLAKLARLRIDTASGAPHKPLLLLVVLDLAEQQAFGPDVLPLTPQLAFRFCSYWQIVAHRRKQKPDVRWPFTKLKTEGVWLPLDDTGKPTADHKRARSAKLNSEFVAAASDPAFREHARRILIAKYFEPAERVALYTLLGMPDNGLWSLDDDYRVLIATDRFDEDAPDQKPLKDYAGQRVRLPSNELIWPDPKHLAWHREKKFDGN